MSRAAVAPVYRPRPPLLGWPQQWVFDGGYAWLTPTGPAIVVQTLVPVVGAAHVHSLHDVLDALVRARVTQRLPGLALLHDRRSVGKIEASARQAWSKRTDRPGKRYASVKIHVSLGPSPILRMALKSAALAVQLAVGQRVAHFVDDPQEVLDTLHIGPPAAGFLEPWLEG